MPVAFSTRDASSAAGALRRFGCEFTGVSSRKKSQRASHSASRCSTRTTRRTNDGIHAGDREAACVDHRFDSIESANERDSRAVCVELLRIYSILSFIGSGKCVRKRKRKKEKTMLNLKRLTIAQYERALVWKNK